MARLDLTTDYVAKYTALSEKMLDKGSIFDKQIDLMKEKFDEFGLTSEQLAEATTQMFIQVGIAYNRDVVSAVNSLLKQEADEPTKNAQADLTIRQKQGYDDNILIKLGEQKSSVASFAVNSASDSAQSALDNMNATMDVLESRVVKLDNELTCPPFPVVVTPPTNMGVDSQTDTSITVSWATVLNATSYELFVDGTAITTTGQTIQTIDSLTPSTKYSFSVRAYIGSDVSNYSETVIGTTNATV